MPKNPKLEDELRDAIQKRMLEMPHKPHEPLKAKRKPTKGKGRVRVGKSRR